MCATRRLFFALWPEDRIRVKIVDRALSRSRSLGGRSVPRHNLHLTLLFLGEVPVECVGTLMQGAGAIRCRGFDLRLDRFGTFPEARVAWLGGDPPRAGLALVAKLHELAVSARVPTESANKHPDSCSPNQEQRRWRPHVTLRRRIDARISSSAWNERPEPIDWTIRSFALIESIPGRPYQLLRTWPVE